MTEKVHCIECEWYNFQGVLKPWRKVSNPKTIGTYGECRKSSPGPKGWPQVTGNLYCGSAKEKNPNIDA